MTVQDRRRGPNLIRPSSFPLERPVPNRKKLPNTAKNPFEYGRELRRDELVDRQNDVAIIQQVVRNRGKLFLIGPRRFGKTSLLAAAAEEAEKAGTVVLRLDAERYESPDLLAEAILASATRRLASSVERASQLLKKAAAKLRPTLAYNLEGQAIELSLGSSSAPGQGTLPVLVDVLDSVEQMAAATSTPVVVVIDEFQELIRQGGERAERQIRSAVQRHRRVGYIFAGSATRMLADMTSDTSLALLSPR